MQRLQRWPLCHCALCFGNLVFSSWPWLWQPQIHITLGIFRGCQLWDPVCIVWLQPRHVFNRFESTKSQSTSSQIFAKLSWPRLVQVVIKPFHCVVLAALSFWPKPKDTKGLENLNLSSRGAQFVSIPSRPGRSEARWSDYLTFQSFSLWQVKTMSKLGMEEHTTFFLKT